MYDLTELKLRKPIHAEGHPCIMLTDPITGKIKEKVEGKNQVFLDMLLCKTASLEWIDNVSSVWTCLNDSTIPIDANIPYLLGQSVGYGKPTTAGTGNFRGSYNSANQVLARTTVASVYWKFQYDFLPSQANGVINSVGLTHQYKFNTAMKPISSFPVVADNSAHGRGYVSDGRYAYNCSDAGIITKYDILLGTSVTIDVSAIVGTSGYKTVGYAIDTGKYYIYANNYSQANSKMYVFSNNIFSILETTYSPTNFNIPSSGLTMYVYGDTAFCLHITTTNTYWYADFVANTAGTEVTATISNNVLVTESNSSSGLFGNSACPLNNKCIITGLQVANTSDRVGVIFDLSTKTIVGTICSPIYASYNYCAAVKYPLTDAAVPYVSTSSGGGTTGAIAAKKLDVPVTKTSANGMTVTYELEVFW